MFSLLIHSMSHNTLVSQAILKIHTVETETAHSYKHTYMCVCDRRIKYHISGFFILIWLF